MAEKRNVLKLVVISRKGKLYTRYFKTQAGFSRHKSMGGRAPTRRPAGQVSEGDIKTLVNLRGEYLKTKPGTPERTAAGKKFLAHSAKTGLKVAQEQWR